MSTENTTPIALPAISGLFFRSVAQVAAGSLVAKGIVKPDLKDSATEIIVGILIWLVTLAWSYFAKRKIEAKAASAGAVSALLSQAEPSTPPQSSTRIGPNPPLGLFLLALCCTLVYMTGCAGDKARDKVLAPVVVVVWPEIKTDALIGINVQEEDGTIGPGVAESKRERIKQFDEAVKTLTK